MAQDTSYDIPIYRAQGGKAQHIGSGASLVVDAGGTADVSAGTFTLAAGQIATAALAAGAVTNAKLAAGAVQASNLAQPTIVNDFTGTGFRVARASYVFANQGGAVSTIALTGVTGIPANAVILGGWLDVSVAPTSSGSATIAVQVEGANDLINAAAISGAPWSTTGRKSVIPVFTGASSVKTTVARDISIVVATAALTAGTFDVYLFYVVTA